MKVAIIGTGNMGSGLASALATAGHEISIGARDLVKAAALADTIGHGAVGGGILAAAKLADVVVLALPYGAAADAIKLAEGLAGKVVVDISNPISADYQELVIGHTTSAAEEIQKLAPQAHVVKAFNTIFAQLLAPDARQGKTLQVFVAGDDAAAKVSVSALATSIGFEAVEAGSTDQQPLYRADRRDEYPLWLLPRQRSDRGSSLGADLIELKFLNERFSTEHLETLFKISRSIMITSSHMADGLATVQANRQFMQRFVLFINTADPTLATELVSSNAVFFVPGRPDPVSGPAGYLEIINMMRSGFPDIQWTLEETVAEGDKVVARFTMRGTHQGTFFGVPATGKKIAVQALNIYRFSDGKIIEERGQPDLLGLLQQIGALPSQ